MEVASVTDIETKKMDKQTMKEILDSKIPRDVISKRDAGAGMKLDYLEGWYVISRMNDVFGQGNWGYDMLTLTKTFEGVVNDKNYVSYVAEVRVWANVTGEDGTVRQTAFRDVGFGDGQDKYNMGKTHELATKEAVTDGIKRCAKNFGYSLGLALYDRSREFVEDEKQSKDGAGNITRTSTKGPKLVQKSDSGNTDASAPVASVTGGDENSLNSKAKTREEVNALISATCKVLISKKLFNGSQDFRDYMQDKYEKGTKESLSDAQAREFLDYLDTMNRKVI